MVGVAMLSPQSQLHILQGTLRLHFHTAAHRLERLGHGRLARQMRTVARARLCCVFSEWQLFHSSYCDDYYLREHLLGGTRTHTQESWPQRPHNAQGAHIAL